MLLASYFGLTGGTCPAGIASYIGNGRALDAGHLVLAENNRLDLSDTHGIDYFHLDVSSDGMSHWINLYA